jgi:hypothetical protein
MSVHLFRVAVTVICATFVVACASSIDAVKNAPPAKGDERVFAASQERIHDLIMKTLWASGLDIVSIDTRDDEMVIMATTPMTMSSWGDIIRVILAPVDSDRTRVNVYWRPRFRDGLLVPGKWEQEIFKSVDDLL